jgi:hypothetical protein
MLRTCIIRGQASSDSSRQPIAWARQSALALHGHAAGPRGRARRSRRPAHSRVPHVANIGWVLAPRYLRLTLHCHNNAVLGFGTALDAASSRRPLPPGGLGQGMVAFGFVASLPHAITVASGVRRAGRRPVRAKPRAVYPRAVQRLQPAQRSMRAIGPTLRPLNTAGPCPVAPAQIPKHMFTPRGSKWATTVLN